MKTHIEFTHQRIVLPTEAVNSKETGAQVEFQGIVRELENGKSITGLIYEAHEAMALKELNKILADLSLVHLCEEIWLIHRLGFVPVGEVSLFIRVHSKHRREALQMAASLIDHLKMTVPIWKAV